MTRAPAVTLVDGALPAPRFKRLLRAIEHLGAERLRESYQTTFWFPFDQAPSNLVEDAVLILRELIPAPRRAKVKGVEWWLSRMRTSNVKVDFHHDRDNAYFDRTGLERRPKLSTILYLNSCRGGLLAVTAQPCNPKNPACAPDIHDFDVVEPRPNRFAFFDAKLTHGVLDARNQLPGQRLPTEPGWRLAIAINFWHQAPENVLRFEATPHYRALRFDAQRQVKSTAPRRPTV
jgi:hypothetical protein